MSALWLPELNQIRRWLPVSPRIAASARLTGEFARSCLSRAYVAGRASGAGAGRLPDLVDLKLPVAAPL